MGRKTEPRELEFNGFKAEILGSTKDCKLIIDGKHYMPYYKITTLREARRLFRSFASRH